MQFRLESLEHIAIVIKLHFVVIMVGMIGILSANLNDKKNLDFHLLKDLPLKVFQKILKIQFSHLCTMILMD